ncbi:MAG: diguanylate cyclase, partial [Lachnospiraceae bacterium]|nr:diguanylate cyclase [Lachnospiraceae bacterium]
MRKRIAILTGQADEEFQSRFIKGFLEQAHVNDQDVCVFSMFLKYQDSVEREVGEANIFHLPNWDLFDGVAIMKDVIQTPGTNDEIENTLKENFKGEVLAIDIKSDLFESVITDGHHATHVVVSHLIEDHGYRKIA